MENRPRHDIAARRSLLDCHPRNAQLDGLKKIVRGFSVHAFFACSAVCGLVSLWSSID